eukprot:TRINITY_DN3841_c0_g1_i1.p1 TRINITY_DN3841_c0_g1~~TRINITY_DN3841_c0_g1_i1.p1  ORF type:complete len:488 (-),score=109.40 TRINITY_DN3841_c0_g1_i1:10-1272(-)
MYEVDEKVVEKIKEISATSDIYSRLAKSIAPEVWGMEDVKKTLLLQMVGSPTKSMSDGIKIRGDLNVMLVGDPGVAKSQLLKHIAGIAPRAVYTSGKGSSGVGLTAAVIKDATTGEFVLEGGSLVLADTGICCIDEFDKMEESDRTAIHEVMEQQTISIAKAGITTTLNARTSILAAANPAYGRYHTGKSPSENINLPAALLSRFDILFLLLDIPTPDGDRELSDHITHVHMTGAPIRSNTQAFSADFLRGYIACARKVEPSIPRSLTEYIVTAYVNLRREESTSPNEYYYTSARSLLSILRFSLAMARLRFSDVVAQGDLEEAIRLLNQSKSSLKDRQQRQPGFGGHVRDDLSDVYSIIRDLAVAHGSPSIQYADALALVLAKGFKQHQFEASLAEYEKIGVWQVNSNRTIIKMLGWEE